ncbi:hypothetical protein C2G38_2253588 [Gigaspora rosea]|uniref:BTB domain-containing protein n=1 Tax=Gigaspora rosea TaxID=44941 RepID=A0A397UAQ8_9GLOM|nr:hypothetical protein C2G38_2253588 [Gigaspora rosea]
MVIKLFEKLSNNYIELFEKGEDYNVIINVGESPNAKEFKAYSGILKYRSKYFQNELTNAIINTNSITRINLKPHISTQQFEIIIKYIYGGIISLEEFDAQFIFDLLLVTDELLFGELTEIIETHLIESNAHWLRSHFSHIYKSSFENKNLKKLQKWCNDIVAKYPNLIFDSENFVFLKEDALISLIQRDDLQMEEIKIWNNVIKWGIAQNTGLPSDLGDWSCENFMTLNSTLKNCLPFIRYFQISADDAFNNIWPYSHILEKKLWKDLSGKFMFNNYKISSIVLPPRTISKPDLPNRSMEPFSAVINEEHTAEIASWIDKTTTAYSTTNNPYEFKLLLRGSRDGFNRKSFWNLCNLKENTITVINIKISDNIERIISGYNPITWDRSKIGWVNCQDSFIFSLKNSVQKDSILSRVKRPEYAFHYDDAYRGADFGGGCNLSMFVGSYDCQDKGCYCAHSSRYQNQIVDNGYYFINEYEVFQIHKKI